MSDEERPEGVWKYVLFQDGSKMLLVEQKKNLGCVRCGKCDRVGMVGLNCNKRDCKTKFHRYIRFMRLCQ